MTSQFLVARAVWLDRVAFLFTTMTALTPPAGLMLYLIYEKILGNDISKEYVLHEKIKENLTSTLSVPLFITGHTHRQEIRQVTETGYYINAGFWGPQGVQNHGKIKPSPNTTTATIIEKDRNEINIILLKMENTPIILYRKKINMNESQVLNN